MAQPIKEEKEEIDYGNKENATANPDRDLEAVSNGAHAQNVFKTLDQRGELGGTTWEDGYHGALGQPEDGDLGRAAGQTEPQAQNESEEAQLEELQQLQVLSGCIKEMSARYEAMANKFQDRIAVLESVNVNADAEAAQQNEDAPEAT